MDRGHKNGIAAILVGVLVVIFETFFVLDADRNWILHKTGLLSTVIYKQQAKAYSSILQWNLEILKIIIFH